MNAASAIQFRDGNTPTIAMHDMSGALLTVRIGLTYGKANVVAPSPPYIVPRMLNKAMFWVIGNIWPLAGSQFTGQKLPANVMISPRYGSIPAWDGIGRQSKLASAAAPSILVFMGHLLT